ncbi:hypothetical protein [Ancylomarina longa]|nr:hypothetical protein [Ancylomarina longa]
MKTLSKFAPLVLVLLIPCLGFSQTKNKTNSPNENIKVKKEFDKNGNLIRYDSTYVYSWSSDSSKNFIADSSMMKQFNQKLMKSKFMMNHFRKFFRNDSLMERGFTDPFFSNDFFDDDFFNPDFFNKDSLHESQNFFKDFDKMMNEHMKFREEHMQRMNHQMDSLRKEWIQKQQEYFQKRNSLNRKHHNKLGKTISM